MSNEAMRLADQCDSLASIYDAWNPDVYRQSATLLRQLSAERDQLRAEVERLRKDGERLDHIQKHARCDPKMDGNHVWWPTNFKHALNGNTLREAIDSSIAGSVNADQA
jgi:hypothetical protein